MFTVLGSDMEIRVGRFILLCMICALWTARTESLDGATSTEDIETTAPDEDIEINAPTASDEEDDNNNPLILGNLSLCQNVVDNVFLPFVGDCNKYYLCRSGQAIELRCEWPYEFDAATQSCVSPGKANCLPTCKAFHFSTFSYQRTCTKYVLCYYGHPVLRECQDDLQYNPKTDRCDFPQNVDCVESECSIYFNAYHLRYVPSKSSCEKYFLCGNGIPRAQTCSTGLHFSTKCNCCDIPSNSNCQLKSPSSTRSNWFKDILQILQIPAQRRLNYQPVSPKPSEVVCPPEGVHFYVHETRPDAYHYCAMGHGLVLECSPGLWFDLAVKECREPKNVGHQN
ncbi:uncharacterized protein Dana_GF10951, isoform B [Drosophila ananassae]|uniref:Uncharacterized protein, isoform B n=1 Tax=Drosophila ananassae TaxID=7217 RepID=B3MAL6_DROAN|nr:uncharacterized protein Dana_GF10951, isoform B [Drosophila ananassae]